MMMFWLVPQCGCRLQLQGRSMVAGLRLPAWARYDGTKVLEAMLREIEDSGGGDSHFVIVYDFSKAHRLVPVREAD